MKKFISLITVFLAMFTAIFSIKVYAATLENIDITTTKTTINSGEDVTVDIEFGEELGSYTFDIAYDSQLFEFVSAIGGTANDNGTRVRVYFFDEQGGTNPRSNMSVTFRAKKVTTSNPTEFSITASGLSNEDASGTYDDITVPIIKSVVVEPEYVDYDIKLEYTGEIEPNKLKQMQLIISSTMGKNYEHTRIITEVETPNQEATVNLFATDAQQIEHDIIESGWGSPEGDPIGGENVTKILNLNASFSDIGQYSITFKVINRDNSDEVIASETFDITVGSQGSVLPEVEGEVFEEEEPIIDKEPSIMPQTGNTVYIYAIPLILILVLSYIILKKKN